MKDSITSILSVAIWVGIIFMVYHVWFTTPIVVISHSTGQCVEVISPEDADTCDSLPKRYSTEWSQ